MSARGPKIRPVEPPELDFEPPPRIETRKRPHYVVAETEAHRYDEKNPV